jgi:hypothetical protein
VLVLASELGAVTNDDEADAAIALTEERETGTAAVLAGDEVVARIGSYSRNV